MIEIHTEARKNIDMKAEALVFLLKVVPRPPQQASESSTEIPVSAIFTDKDIIGEIKESISDYKGRTRERFFIDNGVRIGLVSSDYKQLICLAESIQRIPTIREKLSQDFIEDALFSWAKGTLQRELNGTSFFAFLEKLAEENIKQITVYVPISSTIVDEPFEFCGVSIQNLSKASIDDFAVLSDAQPDDESENSSRFFEKFRKDFQGRAVIRMNLECELNFANIISLEKAKSVTDLLGIYSGAVLMPEIKSTSKIKGTENIEQCTVISHTESKTLHVTSQILDHSSARFWRISKSEVEKFRACGLDILSAIYNRQNRSEFEKTILNMAYLYSKAAFTSDAMEKLVYILSALESTLLKNENEPIQQNLAERMAILTVQQLEIRKDIVKNVKAVYGLRSRYLHHGHSIIELEQLEKFFFNVWILFVNLLNNAQRFKSKEDFLMAIDDHKLS